MIHNVVKDLKCYVHVLCGEKCKNEMPWVSKTDSINNKLHKLQPHDLLVTWLQTSGIHLDCNWKFDSFPQIFLVISHSATLAVAWLLHQGTF